MSLIKYLNYEVTNISVTSLSHVLNSIIDFANSPSCTIDLPIEEPLRHKSEKQCSGKIKQYNQEMTLFMKIQQQIL